MDYVARIFQVVIEGNFAEVKRLLNISPTLVTAQDGYHNPPLHHAPTPEIAELLIQYGANVNARGWMNDTALHETAMKNRPEVARVLIANGANVNALRDGDISPLNWAKSLPMAQILLENGAKVSHQDVHGQSPFFNAVISGDIAFVNLFIDYGVKADVVVRDGKTALHIATNVTVLKRLLDLGLSVNAISHSGDTPLHNAVFRGNAGMVRLLLDHGADVKIRNRDGFDSVRMAKEKAERSVIDILEQHVREQGINLYEIPKNLISREMIVNPRQSEAITVVDHAILARWELSNPPTPIQTLYTEHLHLRLMACSADGEQLLIWVEESTKDSVGFLELRSWKTLALIKRVNLIFEYGVHSAAFSPDGTWLALDEGESVKFFNLITEDISLEVPGGEWTGAICFSPSSQLVAIACSFQGGGYVGIHHITNNGVKDGYEFGRSDINTPANRFVDTLVAIAFSPDSRHLVLFETSRIYHDFYPNGWRGNLVLYDLTYGTETWQSSIDGTVTKDFRSLREAGYGSGFFTQVIFVNQDTIACGSTAGNILLYHVKSGELFRRFQLNTQAAVIRLAADVSGTALWVLLNDGVILSLAWPLPNDS